MPSADSETLTREVKSALRIEDEFRADGAQLVGSGRDLKCCCPFHDENTPSCVIHTEDQYFKCHGCGKGGDIFTYLALRLNITTAGNDFIEVMREACGRAGIEFPDTKAPKAPPKPRTIYTLERLRACCEFQARDNAETLSQWNEYTNPDTKAIEAITIRFDKNGKKRLLQATPNGDGFSFGLQGDDRKQPLFNRTRVRNASVVVIVEGETKVRLLTKLDIVSTCNIGGSKAADRADWSPLEGKQVIIWRDNDDAGLGWQEQIITELWEFGVKPAIVDISRTAIEKGDDVCDFHARLTCEDKTTAIIDVLRGSMPETLASQVAADMAGTRFAITHESFYALASTLCFLPGSITMICASPGVSKSFLLLQWIWNILESGISACVFELESGDVFHDRRLMAQLAQNSMFLNPRWCLENPSAVDELMANYGAKVNEYKRLGVVQFHGDNIVSAAYLIKCIEKEAAAGRKVIAIDPVTMLDVEDEENFWKEQKNFVRALKKLVWKYQIRIILVTHPKKGADKIHPDNMAGSVAFQQNTDTILWLEAHPVLERSETTASGFVRQKYNRTMHIQKSRLGPAKKPTIGYFFDGGTLLHHEVGFLDG